MKILQLAGATLMAVTAAKVMGAGVDAYVQANLQSDLPGVAANVDPDLVNPWGITASSSSPFWTSDNGTGKSTLYNTAGSKLGLVVTIPPAAGASPPSDPTGIVFNGTASNFGGAHFLFDTESGTIAAWSSGGTATIATSGA